MLDERPWEEGDDADDMWLKMATCVRKMTSEVFGNMSPLREILRSGISPRI
jgi:hypothetical protein